MEYRYHRNSDDRHISIEHISRAFAMRFDITPALNVGRAPSQQGGPRGNVLVDEFSKEDLWNEMLQRSRKLFVSANPEGPNHWFKQQYLDPLDDAFFAEHQYFQDTTGDDDFVYVPFTQYDNPSERDRPDYAMLQRRLPQYLVERRVNGKWAGATGQVYPFHGKGRPPKGRPDEYFTGIDFGSAHVTYAVMFGSYDGTIWAIDEWRHDAEEPATRNTHGTEGRLNPVEQAEAIWQWIGDRPQSFIACDSLPAEYIAAMRNVPQTNPVAVIPAEKGPDSVDIGVGQIQWEFSTGQLRIDIRLDHLISGLNRYSFKELANGEFTEQPDHTRCDEVDAMRYAITRRVSSEREGLVRLA